MFPPTLIKILNRAKRHLHNLQMVKLPAGWNIRFKGKLVPEGTVLYQGLTLPVEKFNDLSSCNLFGVKAGADTP